MAYQVVPFRLEEHRGALLQLWRNFGSPWLDASADRRLEWLYQQNPFGPARTWLATESAGGEVIGCASVSPVRKHARGRAVTVGIAIDFTVEPSHRSAGAAVALQRVLTRESRRAGFAWLTAKPNRLAIPILARVGYRSIGGGSRNWVKALDGDAETGAHVDALFFDELAGTADERFDDLWNRTKSRYPVVGEKTAAYLNWRYSTCTAMDYRLYCLLDRGDRRLMGYIVYAHMDKGAFIAELFADDLMGRTLEPLLRGFAARMRAEAREWVALSYLGDPSFEERLQELGFSARKRSHAVLAYVDPDAADLAADVFDCSSSLVFGGEMDLF
jgi:GNAT superfamily N-acetyltransferase